MEAVLRKKVYQRAIDRTLEKNFQLMLKVSNGGGETKALLSHGH